MVQNRNKLIDLFVGNISNAIIHQILENAIECEEISGRYIKESIISLDKAKQYREKINPNNRPLPFKDINNIKNKTISKIKVELSLRISRGYKNIDLGLINKLVDKILEDMIVI